jgi:hypothetical protein
VVGVPELEVENEKFGDFFRLVRTTAFTCPGLSLAVSTTFELRDR